MDARHIGLDPDPYRNAALGIGYRVGDLIVLSGHASLDDDGRFVDGDFAGQAGRALDNLDRALRAAGSGPAGIVRLGAWLTEVAAQRPVLLALLPRRFAAPYPALTAVGIAMRRHPEWLVEIDAVAVVGRRCETATARAHHAIRGASRTTEGNQPCPPMPTA